MKCVYISMDSLEDFVSDADLSVPAMEALGWSVEKRSWRDRSVDWDTVDLAYVCTPWDYHEHLEEFMQALERIDASRALLVNDLDTIRWNAIKTYLRELENRGFAVVPTEWHDVLTEDCLQAAFEAFDAERIVIKPVVGANAMDTHVLVKGPGLATAALHEAYRDRPFMLQPFLGVVQDVGEYSLFFFDGDYSHAILKVPKKGDFRTQEEHGSDIRPHVASPELISRARDIVDSLEPGVAYARVDFVSAGNDEFLLMELELIEPSLYFRTDPTSTERFARGLTSFYRRETGA
ncbi:MAG: hypothetical protein QNJ05_02755 [Woeseiaceae bacterium]|nr:hypothetical protein [Woeseiaceae bacterium]